ncbi:class I SAM-dependent methyltransferase [Streptomyces sp. RFCAC02]|uniref:class I SAM-dependent methyltransferase n=1 Tax=Streptomyces sp. RFCAC02 TaxID=2499143 RepID=UPI0010219101|nr:class I SAM-dependent methyltransferase [Streptomyces sp. RFCAC02]
MTDRSTDHATEEPFAALPRGGPRASRLDRRYETDRPEHLDGTERPDRSARVLRGLDRMHRLTGGHRVFTRRTLALARADGAPAPRVLELGAGHGGLARRLLAADPAVRLTVSDIDPATVRALREGPLGRHPRADVLRLDATAMDAPDGGFDLAVFALSLHHLPPPAVVRVLREGTRVARRLLLIDGWRHPAYLAAVPLLFLTGGPAHVHDGVISFRKMYSPAALREMAGPRGADVRLTTRFVPPGYLEAVATARPRA